MPCIEGTNIAVALQILDAVTPRDTDSAVNREITQTDHLNKHLLKVFLDRLNLMTEVLAENMEEEENIQEFDD